MINPASSALVEGQAVDMSIEQMRRRALDVTSHSAELRSVFAEGGYHDIEPTAIECLARDVLQLLNERKDVAPLLDALRIVDPQTLPREFADLVMKWRANTG